MVGKEGILCFWGNAPTCILPLRTGGGGLGVFYGVYCNVRIPVGEGADRTNNYF